MIDRNTIIVTGGAGFIGSNVVAALNERGTANVVIVDHLGSTEKWKNLRGLAFEEFIPKDDFIAQVRASAHKAPRAIIHMGACSATTELDADYLMANNVAYTRTLCEWSLREKFRLVLASSAATYGDGSQGYSDDDAVTPTLHPLNMYGYSKQFFDEWALRHGHYDKIVGLKFFNVYGPREAHKGNMRSVVHKAYHEVLEKGTIRLFKSDRADYADGMQQRDFVYVRDAVEVMLHFLDKPEIGGLYNCGTGTPRTWLDLAHAVFSAMGRAPQIEWIDLPPSLRGKYQYFTQADPAKLRAKGHYGMAFTTLEAGVAAYVKWLDAGNP